ncbi:MAG: hypothetical protein WA584_23700 [Pyrinomonadaceae bacterium]
MRKYISTLILITMLSIFAVADDGHLPGGDKTCTPGQPGCSRVSLDETENPVIKTVTDFLISVFG